MTASGDITQAWVLIDSDGEDEPDANGLRESDIVSFLNQVPFGEIFRQVYMSKTVIFIIKSVYLG